GDDVRVRETGGRAGLAAKTLGGLAASDQIVPDDLDRDAPFERQVRRRVDRAHAAAPQPTLEPIPPLDDPRQEHRHEPRAIGTARGGAAVVARAALRALLEDIRPGRR